jgi:hypothetical protein
MLGSFVLDTTNPAWEREALKQKELANLPLDQRSLAQRNKAELVDYLRSIEQGKDDGSRYSLALQGKVAPAAAAAEQKLRYGVSQPATKEDS